MIFVYIIISSPQLQSATPDGAGKLKGPIKLIAGLMFANILRQTALGDFREDPRCHGTRCISTNGQYI